MSEEKKVPKQGGLYRFARFVANVALHTFWPVKYHGFDKLLAMPAPYVLISNHHSGFDPLIVAAPMSGEEITFLGKKELAKNELFKKILTDLHMIMVDRHNMDMAAMRSCIKTVRDGHILGIFPEGTRYHDDVMEHPEEGTALLTMRTGVPLVPVYIGGKAKAFRVTHVYAGEPIPYEDLKAEGVNKETCAKLDQRMIDTYREFQDEHPFVW